MITPLRIVVATFTVLVAAFGVFDRPAQNFLGIGLGNDFGDIDFVASDCTTRADNKSCHNKKIDEFAFHGTTSTALS